MKKQMNALLSFLFVVLAFSAFSQTRTVSGNVTDESGEPAIAATVKVTGTSLGAVTDMDGNFTINNVSVSAETLTISSIGYADKVVAVSDFVSAVITIEDTILDDVIVTGYSTQEVRRFAGSAVKVGAGAVDDKSTADISQALAGEVSGVSVINTNGQPGTSSSVRIRGFGSVNGNRAPLYVVDGVPYEGDLSALNPSDIESTTVLKDASATALYGSRGANGVIVITTKKGTKGDNKIEFDVKQGTNFRGLPYYNTIQSPEEYIELAWQGLKNAYGADDANKVLYGKGGLNPYYNIWDVDGETLIDPQTGKFRSGVKRRYTPTRRRDAFFDNGNRTEANLSISGGEGKTKYRTSFGVLDEDGYFLKSDFTRYNSGLSLEHQVKSWLKGSMSLNYSNSTSNFSGQSSASSQNGFYLERNAPPIYDIYYRNQNGGIVDDPIFGGGLFDYGDVYQRRFSNLSNVAGDNAYNIDRTKRSNLIGNVNLVATFLKNFDFTLRTGSQLVNGRGDYLANRYYGQAAGSEGRLGGSLDKTTSVSRQLSFLEMLSYTKSFNDHNLALSAAHETQEYKYSYQYANATDLNNPFSLELSNVLNQNPGDSYTYDANIESYFAFLNYDFKGKYFLNASVRRDGSSRFADGNKWGTFPSVGAGWLISEEDFIKSSDAFPFLKLRASYGLTGEQEGVTNNRGRNFYQNGGNLFRLAPIAGFPSLQFDTAVDPNITWETAKQFDLGVDFSLKGIIDGTLDFYNKKTVDLYYYRELGPSAGIAAFLVNDGELLNRGFEFDLTGHVVNQKDLKIDLSVNGATLKNEILKNPIDNSTGAPKVLSTSGRFARAKGYSVYDYYVRNYEGVNSENGNPLYTLFYNDKNSNNTVDDGEGIKDYVTYMNDNPDATIKKSTTENYNDATQYFTGESLIPDLQGGFRLKVDYKGFGLSSQFLYSFGGHGYDGNYAALMGDRQIGNNNFHADMRNMWRKDGDVTTVPKITDAQGPYSSVLTATSTRFITKSDYLLLNNVRLNYNFPSEFTKRIGLSGAKIWLSGDNLFAKTAGRDGFFPWVTESGQTNREAYDPLSTFTTGVSLKF